MVIFNLLYLSFKQKTAFAAAVFWCPVIHSFVCVNLLCPFRGRNSFSDWMDIVLLHYTTWPVFLPYLYSKVSYLPCMPLCSCDVTNFVLIFLAILSEQHEALHRAVFSNQITSLLLLPSMSLYVLSQTFCSCPPPPYICE
jgi:hypothetical protein